MSFKNNPSRDWVNKMSFQEQYKVYLTQFEEVLTGQYPAVDLLQKKVFEAMRYGVLDGGKRIRPILTMAVCDMLGGNLADAARVGCAIESIHSYSLIHDDLPCMDNDDMRRGKPSCHKAFGEDIALLAGDGLLTNAFGILAETDLPAELALATVRELSKAAGCYGMIGGQVIDLACEDRTDVTLEELTELHRGKTGALIRVSAVCGCLCGGYFDESHEKIQKIVAFSEKLGLAFQIKDDILDVIGDELALGKPIGSDAEQNKTTFVTLLGLEKAEEELARLTKEAKELIGGIPGSEFLLDFADYLLNRNH